MFPSKDMSYFCGLPYRTYVRKGPDGFTILIPELGILESDSDLKSAFEKAESLKREFFKKALDGGYEDEIVEPSNREEKKRVSLLKGMGTFSCKLLIATFLLYAFWVIFMMPTLTGMVGNMMDKIAMKAPAIFNKTFSAVAERIYLIGDRPDDGIRDRRLMKTVRSLNPLLQDVLKEINNPLERPGKRSPESHQEVVPGMPHRFTDAPAR